MINTYIFGMIHFFIDWVLIGKGLSYLVDPQFAHYDVVDRGGHFFPGVVIIALLKDGMDGSYTKKNLKILNLIMIPPPICGQFSLKTV